MMDTTSTWVGIEQLRLSKSRPSGALPPVAPDLLDLVRRHGPIDPVVVRPDEQGGYEIVRNVETWLAVQQSGQHKVPIVVREDLDDDEVREILQQTAAKFRADPIAEAELFENRADELGGRRKRGVVSLVAREVGKSSSYISHSLRLLELPERIQQMVRRGELTPGHARPLISVTDRKKRLRLADRIVLQKLSVRDAEHLARGRRVEAKRAPTHDSNEPNPDADLRRLEVRISDTLGCQARLDHQGGRLVIRYSGDLDVLQGILIRLGCTEN